MRRDRAPSSGYPFFLGVFMGIGHLVLGLFKVVDNLECDRLVSFPSGGNPLSIGYNPRFLALTVPHSEQIEGTA